MSFTILACSDIRAQKVNLEFPFSAPPATIEDLRHILEQTFRGEEEAIKRANGYTDTRACEPFSINRLQKYDDDTQTWAEVTSPQMLQTYDQLYVFRKNTTKADIATERELPAPRKSPFFPYVQAGSSGNGGRAAAIGGLAATPALIPPTVATSYPRDQEPVDGTTSVTPYRYPNSSHGLPGAAGGGGGGGGLPRYSPPRGSVNYTLLPPPSKGAAGAAAGLVNPDGSVMMYRERTTPERVEYLFRFADQGRRGSIGPREFEVLFRAADIRFPPSVVFDLHQHFAMPPATAAAVSGAEPRMSLDDFQRYAGDFPVAVNIAYQRITNQEREEAMVAAQREAAQRAEDLARQVRDLEERLAAAHRELQRQADQKARLQDGLQEIYRQRDPEYCRDEQQLLDKEVSVFKYRERLSLEEQDYERLAMERRRRTAHQGGGGMDGSPISGAGRGYSTVDDGRYGPA